MKRSKLQQQLTRGNLIRAAVALMTEQGYEATTMKQIARAAGVGDATVYKYFPTKENILLEFFELRIADVLAGLANTPSFDQFTLQERLQLLVDGILEGLLPDREFVAIARSMVAKSPFMLTRGDMPAQAALRQQVVAFITYAEDSGEIAPCDFKNLIGGLFTDYLLAVMSYWLQDESDEFSDTTQLVDLTLAILVLALKSGVINKMSELASFMIRSQMARLMQNGSGLLDLLKSARRGMGGAA